MGERIRGSPAGFAESECVCLCVCVCVWGGGVDDAYNTQHTQKNISCGEQAVTHRKKIQKMMPREFVGIRANMGVRVL